MSICILIAIIAIAFCIGQARPLQTIEERKYRIDWSIFDNEKTQKISEKCMIGFFLLAIPASAFCYNSLPGSLCLMGCLASCAVFALSMPLAVRIRKDRAERQAGKI